MAQEALAWSPILWFLTVCVEKCCRAHDVGDAAKQDSSVGSRADRFAASHHGRRSGYVPGAGMSAEAKALLGQVVFNDPKGFGAHAMEFGQFRARDTCKLTQGCVARVA
jgi:hypothetical protein